MARKAASDLLKSVLTASIFPRNRRSLLPYSKSHHLLSPSEFSILAEDATNALVLM